MPPAAATFAPPRPSRTCCAPGSALAVRASTDLVLRSGTRTARWTPSEPVPRRPAWQVGRNGDIERIHPPSALVLAPGHALVPVRSRELVTLPALAPTLGSRRSRTRRGAVGGLSALVVGVGIVLAVTAGQPAPASGTTGPGTPIPPAPGTTVPGADPYGSLLAAPYPGGTAGTTIDAGGAYLAVPPAAGSLPAPRYPVQPPAPAPAGSATTVPAGSAGGGATLLPTTSAATPGPGTGAGSGTGTGTIGTGTGNSTTTTTTSGTATSGTTTTTTTTPVVPPSPPVVSLFKLALERLTTVASGPDGLPGPLAGAGLGWWTGDGSGAEVVVVGPEHPAAAVLQGREPQPPAEQRVLEILDGGTAPARVLQVDAATSIPRTDLEARLAAADVPVVVVLAVGDDTVLVADARPVVPPS